MISPETARRCRKLIGSRSIVLVGMMGAGKTTVGRRLAKTLQLPFHDADVEIVKAAGKSISDIFAEDGEAFFRNGEERVIRRLLEDGPQVLATGGGAFAREETRANVAEFGISVWLDGSLEVLWERVSRRGHRPLLQQENPKQVLEKLLEERNPLYALSDVRVSSREVPHDVIVKDIVEALMEFLQPSDTGADQTQENANS